MPKYLLLMACTFPLSLFPACDPDADELDADELQADESGADEFGEGEVTPRCAINGFYHFSGTLTASPQNPSLSASMSNSSPTAAYGGISCGDYYVIQASFAPWSHHYLLVDPFWAGPPLTAAQCPWTLLYYDIAVYYDGAWHQRTASVDGGTWNGTKCLLGPRIQVYDPNQQAEKVQVAVKAMFLDATGEHYGKVGARITKTDIIVQ